MILEKIYNLSTIYIDKGRKILGSKQGPTHVTLFAYVVCLYAPIKRYSVVNRVCSVACDPFNPI